jgi:hypothetical protein
LKKLLSILLCVLVAGAAFAQDTETVTVGQFLVTHPVGFVVSLNGEESFSVLDPATQGGISFGTPKELENFFGVTADNAEDAFTRMIDAIIGIGASKAEGGVTSLTLHGKTAQVQKVNPPSSAGGDPIYFGTMTMPTGGWALIGFTQNMENRLDVVQAVLESVAFGDDLVQEQPADLFAVTTPLRAGEMPEGFMILQGETQNTVFEMPAGVKPADNEFVNQSVALLGSGIGTTYSVFLLDTTFLSLRAFVDSYIETIATTMGDATFSAQTSIVESTTADGKTRLDYISPIAPSSSLAAAVIVVQLTDSTAVIVQGIALVQDAEAVATAAKRIADSVFVVDRFAGASSTTSPVGTAIVVTDFVSCFASSDEFFAEGVTQVTLTCPAGCTGGNHGTIWGTDVYTSDSSVCGAAVHFGATTPDGGRVTFTYTDGRASYEGTTRNGVGTNDYGSWGRSFTFVGEPTSAVTPSAVAASCTSRGYDFVSASTPEVVVECPAGCTTGTSIWGTDIYTNDSGVCVAAAHAGVITLADGGIVKVVHVEGQASYSGTTRNGVTTNNYGAWNASFSIAKP